jgi:hypothetical protein
MANLIFESECPQILINFFSELQLKKTKQHYRRVLGLMFSFWYTEFYSQHKTYYYKSLFLFV